MPDSVLLRSAFSSKDVPGLLVRLILFEDRIEVHRLGIRTRVVPLSAVEDVIVSSWAGDAVNLRIRVRGEEDLAGRVDAVLAWKYQLMELMRVKEPPAVTADRRYRLTLAA